MPNFLICRQNYFPLGLIILSCSGRHFSSAEGIVGMLATAGDPATAESCQDAFFAQYLLANVIRNRDSHLKNFGLLYRVCHPAGIVPVYDMLSMAGLRTKALICAEREFRSSRATQRLSLGGGMFRLPRFSC